MIVCLSCYIYSIGPAGIAAPGAEQFCSGDCDALPLDSAGVDGQYVSTDGVSLLAPEFRPAKQATQNEAVELCLVDLLGLHSGMLTRVSWGTVSSFCGVVKYLFLLYFCHLTTHSATLPTPNFTHMRLTRLDVEVYARTV